MLGPLSTLVFGPIRLSWAANYLILVGEFAQSRRPYAFSFGTPEIFVGQAPTKFDEKRVL